MRDDKFLTQFTTFLLTERRVSHNTYLAYKNDIEQLFTFLRAQKQSIATCTHMHLKRYVGNLHKQKLSAKSIARKISSIKLFFAFLHERFTVPNKADKLIFPKTDQRLPIYLTVSEAADLLEAANADTTPKGMRNKVIVHLLYASGMRVSELACLTIDQIHFDTGFIHLMGKGNKERQVPLPQNTLKLLRYYLDCVYRKLLPKNATPKKNYLFATHEKGKEKSLTRQSVWNIIKRLLSLARITKNVSPHTLRHSIATHLLNNGANIRSLQLLLGHEHLTTVQIYTHLETKQIRKIYDKKHPRA